MGGLLSVKLHVPDIHRTQGPFTLRSTCIPTGPSRQGTLLPFPTALPDRFPPISDTLE